MLVGHHGRRVLQLFRQRAGADRPVTEGNEARQCHRGGEQEARHPARDAPHRPAPSPPARHQRGGDRHRQERREDRKRLPGLVDAPVVARVVGHADRREHRGRDREVAPPPPVPPERCEQRREREQVERHSDPMPVRAEAVVVAEPHAECFDDRERRDEVARAGDRLGGESRGSEAPHVADLGSHDNGEGGERARCGRQHPERQPAVAHGIRQDPDDDGARHPDEARVAVDVARPRDQEPERDPGSERRAGLEARESGQGEPERHEEHAERGLLERARDHVGDRQVAQRHQPGRRGTREPRRP